MKYSDRPNAYINAKDLEIAIVKAASYGDALDAVREAPSIEIIRCGECKHWRTKYFKDGHGWCEWHINETKADDFCSYGSRSEKPNNLERSSK